VRVVRPDRVVHRYTQRLVAPPDRVFPLLCPVRELDWVRDWDPSLVITRSGYAEQGCIFTTPGPIGESVWVVTAYEPPERIAFVKVTPGETVVTVGIDLEADADGRSLAHVCYAMTALGSEGAEAVAAFTREAYRVFMETWEAELNHFLRHGRTLPATAG
jgi:hypothetical protein